MFESIAPITFVGFKDGKITREVEQPGVKPYFCLVVKYHISLTNKVDAIVVISDLHRVITDGEDFYRTEQLGELIDDVPLAMIPFIKRTIAQEFNSL